MKKIIVVFLISFVSLNTFGQDITGKWNGLLKVQGMQLRVVFNINKTETGYSATMDSPDQGAKGIPVTTTRFENSNLKIEMNAPKIEYEGVLGNDGVVSGNFKQSGMTFPMNLSRQEIEKEKIRRPQEPVKHYPYYTEDVSFENKKAGITLAGTLTLPQKEGVYPVVILISGSGPQNRDEELMGHKPFLVIADYLTQNGIAVLRYDDRGTAASKGNFKTATSLDFASDTEAAMAYLKTRKEINPKKIGLIGHSEGGLIAPMIASNNKDVAFIILLAGPGIPGDQLLLMQQNLIGKAAGMSDTELQKSEAINKKAFEIVKHSTSIEPLKIELTQLLSQNLKDNPNSAIPNGMSADDYVKLQVDQIAYPWMQYFIKYNPAPALEKVKCPVLALNGEKDLQVPPEANLEAIQKALEKGGNKNGSYKVLPNLNHLFQECETGAPSEYAQLEQTFAPKALAEIVDWTKKVIK
ncbi:alpha/beta hydrolase family protein [Flavobacterium nackdongense]|uniref:Alpha/beta hydrolase n=1 Tax=Flavobacterium nackdongense TaxID=2547394 RepID=A0A4P6YBK8_9FLAO|nr:alpha/beta hydrolase [Flavobacterium nackdongense]QBN18154.1 alpha/beta hydrolase [Flavobacterium nackdongense]